MELDELKTELKEFQKEKDRIRNIVGQIGGTNQKQHKIVNLLFFILIGILLTLGVVLKKITLILSLEIVIIVSVFKLIWMNYSMQASSHFQFWILNSLEYRINEIDKKVRKIEKMLKEEKK